jgi:hypothetical protein
MGGQLVLTQDENGPEFRTTQMVDSVVLERSVAIIFMFLNTESEDDSKTLKKPKESNKSTPSKKGGGGGAKKPSTTPTKKESKKKEDIESISDFFGAAPIKRTTRSTRHDKGGVKSQTSKPAVRLGKRQVQDDGGGGEVSTVPESPTEAILMEFNDEAVALALQEEELEMQKEKVNVITM